MIVFSAFFFYKFTSYVQIDLKYRHNVLKIMKNE